MATVRPELVVHAQALSDVDRCEEEPQLARAMNVQATANLVEALKANGERPALLIALSTDHVFDGAQRRPYVESDLPAPVNTYGRTKLESERHALGYARSIVVRTSTLYGPGRLNYCDHIVARTTAGEPVEAWSDQQTSPTYTEDLAAAMAQLSLHVLDSGSLTGQRVYHLVNAGGCSRVTFAERVVELLHGSKDLIKPIPMAAHQRPAHRPRYAVLDTINVPASLKEILRPWDDALQAYLRQRRPFGFAQDGVLR